MMPAGFSPFLEQAPLCVLTRVTLESLFQPAWLDDLFAKSAQRQYVKELLFSEVVELMMSVVLRVEPSVHAAYKKRQEQLSVSDQAIYDKLRCMETGVCQALISSSAARLTPVIDLLKARQPSLLRGYRVRIVDANCLSATEKRLKPLRQTWAAALPGKVLAVYDQQTDLITDVYLTPDGHAQERTLLTDVLTGVRARDLWIADTAYCTLKFLFGIADKRAAFVIRQHGTLKGVLLGKRRVCGRTETGKLYEQKLALQWEGEKRVVRRITLVLDKPTTDGDTEIHVLTNLPKRHRAAQVAELYRQRWTIERRFYDVTQTLDCEPDTLGYPKAALFAFCLALLASNAVALMKAALRAVHGTEEVQNLSHYYMTLEVRQNYPGMLIALPPQRWTRFSKMTPGLLAKVLRHIAHHVRPERYRKAKRGPKKPPPKKDKYKNGGHVSTHRLLEALK